VNSPPDLLALAGLQARFAAALRTVAAPSDDPTAALAECIVDDGLEPAARVRVYQNNVQAMFEGALARTYPVLRRRVGDDYFARLAAEYRRDHPSRSGDLHWTGRHFPGWIAVRMAGTDYAWLADLARLEWACEEALVAAGPSPAPADILARLPAEELANTMLALQPGLRLLDSAFPVWSVWQANQPGTAGDAVDPTLGAQFVAVVPGDDGLVLHCLPVDRFRFVEQLSAGQTLEQALDASGLPVERLGEALAWLFDNGLVTRVVTSSRDGAGPAPASISEGTST
jgi:hypothetical protein